MVNRPGRLLVVVALVLCLRMASVWAAGGTLRGRVTDPDGLPLPGVLVTLRASASRPLTTTTDQQGVFTFQTPPGRASLRAELQGFEPVHRDVVLVDGTVVSLDLTLRLAAHQEQVTVTADKPQPVIAAAEPNAPVTVTREVVDSSMLPNNQYDDALTLLPTVVRGPDGFISVGGARAVQGALVVNGLDLNDPISGVPALIVPMEAVDSVDVFAGGYAAELGTASGGITSVHTRAGVDQFHSALSSFLPRMDLVNGQVRGLKYWEPNAGMSGPVIKDRVFYQQAISYRFDRNTFGTMAGDQDQKFTSLSSWSQFDVAVAPDHHLVAAISFNPQWTDRYNITAFTPAATVPEVDRHAFNASVADRVTLGESATVDVRANYVRSRLSVTPLGNDPYVVGHDVTQGSYFDRNQQAGARGEGSAELTWTARRGHLVKAGVTLGHATLSGTDGASMASYLRSDGTISRTFRFVGSPMLTASDNEAAAFVQDAWTVSRRATLDAGVRYDGISGVGHAVSPRLAWTIQLPMDGSTLSGSVGEFADKLPLDELVFGHEPARLEQVYDQSGLPAGVPQLFVNQVAALKMPVATRWDLEFDRQIGSRWLVRVKYQERRGRNEPTVQPVAVSDPLGHLLLVSDGVSHGRSLEATAAYRATRGEVYLSYVRSSATGNLNSFDLIDGIMREPFVQPDATGPLPADVPHRVLAWGMMHFPWGISVSPFLEVRSGFPYSAINEDWVRVGLANGYRFPWFGSLDLYVNKIFTLPWHLPQARIGLRCWSIASLHSERDVQRDIGRSDFGTLYNAVPRDFGGVFELLWGRK